MVTFGKKQTQAKKKGQTLFDGELQPHVCEHPIKGDSKSDCSACISCSDSALFFSCTAVLPFHHVKVVSFHHELTTIIEEPQELAEALHQARCPDISFLDRLHRQCDRMRYECMLSEVFSPEHRQKIFSSRFGT